MNTSSSWKADLQDSDWIRHSFLVPVYNVKGKVGLAMSNTKAFDRTDQYSPNALSYDTTTLGGNAVINPKPQFTRYADIKMNSLVLDGGGDYKKHTGMGIGYNESINANAKRIYLTFGVQSFNSLKSFFTSVYDTEQGKMVNAGIVTTALNMFGKYIGFITFWPVIVTLYTSNLLYKAYADITHQPLTKYYYVKPAMTLYWAKVQTILNAIMVNMKLTQGVDHEAVQKDHGENPAIFGQTKADVALLNKILPDIFRNDLTGGLDVRAVANRRQRLADAHYKTITELMDGCANETEVQAKLAAYFAGGRSRTKIPTGKSIKDMNESYAKSSAGTGEHLVDQYSTESTAPTSTPQGGAAQPATTTNTAGGADAVPTSNNSTETDINPVTKLWNGLTKHWEKYMEHSLAEVRQGSMFIGIAVDHEQEVSESFSNSFKESDVISSANSTSSEMRNKIYNMAGGNLGIPVVDQLIEGVGALAGGILDSISLSGLKALGGKAFLTAPEYWANSSTEFSSPRYTARFATPYGNPIAQLIGVYYPLACFLAAVTPNSTGRHTYANPFYCKLWQRGVVQIATGMISDVTITRHAGNVGAALNYMSNAIEVSFTVTDLEKMKHFPISGDLGAADPVGISMFDEDTPFSDYMAVLGGLTIEEQYYAKPRWARKRALGMANFNSWTSMYNFSAWSADSAIGTVVGSFLRNGNIAV